MQLLIYTLVYPLLWLISKLPWRIFYFFSDFIYIFVYYIIGYRKKTVTNNLQLVFPDKNLNEIKKIRKKFYKHMCDMFLEMIRSISISDKELLERFRITNIKELKELESKNKSIIVLMAHYANYEWSSVTQLIANHHTVGIYKKIENKYFDQLVHKIRKRFDATLITNHNAKKEISKDKENGKLCSYGMVSDQSPKIPNAIYWTDFMGIKVPAFLGGQTLAKRLDLSVTYLHVEKIKRGYYKAKFITITENAKDCDDYYIVKTYLRLLEEQIHKAPEYYLWTHNRWKHRNAQKPEGATID